MRIGPRPDSAEVGKNSAHGAFCREWGERRTRDRRSREVGIPHAWGREPHFNVVWLDRYNLEAILERMSMPIKSSLHARFCRNLVERRKELGLTQEELGRRLGISQEAVNALENGRNCPTLDRIDRVAQALDIAPEALLLFELLPVGRNPENRCS